ncbi:unnamed protein product [Gongylonema pulchrum]|uniref:DCB domain-containing protein n=1 Tax=Gongylonema pulchrum TaxID=637853 RepID=A0A183DKK3_9BILA|nr:unnamed protein product [Gongylonema pulchrum]
MQVVCEASQCPETAVKVVAMQCLVRIMSLYYQLMEQYMSALFPVDLGCKNEKGVQDRKQKKMEGRTSEIRRFGPLR